LTTPSPDGVSAAEFEEMKRELGLDEPEPGGHRTSTLTKRLAHSTEEDDAPETRAPTTRSKSGITRRSRRADDAQGRDRSGRAGNGAPPPAPPPPEAEAEERTDDVTPAPDVAENEGMAQMDPKRQSKPRNRNRRHGRRR
ncbi:MAG: hypothetical protein ACLQA5_00510, partial [Solirubrobacteraceae bacterium]